MLHGLSKNWKIVEEADGYMLWVTALHSKQENKKHKQMYLPSLASEWSVTWRQQLKAIAVASIDALRTEEIVDDRSGYILRTPESDFGVFVKYFKLAGS